MTGNTDIWDKLAKTDPGHTKKFTRAGGFSGTAIKPIWTIRRMTEEFGPCGIGWGINEPKFQVVSGDNSEVLVYCTVSIWYWNSQTNQPAEIFGVGGDKVVTHIRANEKYNRPERWENDDEAFKKAYTDAVGNALKFLGVGADVHMGMFDDSKYVQNIAQEFENAKSSAQLKRDGVWEAFEAALADCRNMVQIEALKAEYRSRAASEGWNQSFKLAMADAFAAAAKAINEFQEGQAA